MFHIHIHLGRSLPLIKIVIKIMNLMSNQTSMFRKMRFINFCEYNAFYDK